MIEKIGENYEYEIVAMQKRVLSNTEIESFKNKVFDLKFGQFISDKKLEGKNVIVDASSIDSIRRIEDKENTLYNVLNRVQENIIKGGIKYQVEKENSTRYFSTRKVKSINQDTHFNIELYNYAMDLLVA